MQANRPAAGITEGWGRRATPGKSSLMGMSLGWLMINGVVAAIVLVDWLRTSLRAGAGIRPFHLDDLLWFPAVFGIYSMAVCVVAWLLIAWPATAARWESLRKVARPVLVHGLTGGVAGASTALLLLMAGAGFAAAGVFGLLALVAGAVCGCWTGWRIRLDVIREEYFQRGRLG